MRPTDNEFNARTYLEASREHTGVISTVLDAGQYVTAFYLCGVAVECILRAYYFRNNPVFDARHDLLEIAQATKFIDNMPEGVREQVLADLQNVALRWSNNHRYRSEAALRGFLTRAKLYRLGGGRTIRGDIVSYNATIIAEAALRVVTVGLRYWEKSSANSNHKSA